MRSQSSIETVHGELELRRTPSNFTIDEGNRPRPSGNAEVSLVVERL
ncbi:hypothetical protein OESDEN_03279 [Oesophagostomum dentatum]|uniref:Uncharacterized protein n=1 Tax=Oesophagostomum dentatum TaxID=61180 RepID=A0A0B1TLQ6_OESDE|nr:hypothetical protein OESDEN_03279 [Oesophagostomum dentatum]